MINWEVILWTCVTIVVLMGIFGIVAAVVSAKNMRARRENMKEIYTELKIGSQVMFAGGIYGKVVGIENETVNVEVAKGTVMKISRFAIQSLEKEKNA
ncbi:MAG TPA: preprotein translocase subunit YajC [Candidatus Merdisoma merdipullorum]|nr:preprotein translocase subunit YajC [Candidatus Merdisoma merdipullorum]